MTDVSSNSPVEDERYARLLEVEQAIALLHRGTRARLKELVERFDPDLQPAGFGVLRYVVANCPLRAGDIAAALGMDKSAVSRQLTALRESGLIEMRPDPADGRATLLVSTPAATSALERFRADVRADYERILDTWNTTEITDFAQLLQKFSHSLG